MMINKIRKGLAFAACFSMMVAQAASTTAQAEVLEQIQPLMTYITSYDVSLVISSTGKASVMAFVLSNNTSNYVRVTLQKKSKNGWEGIKSWETSGQGSYTSISETYFVTRGTYRVTAMIKANSETIHVESVSRTY